MQLRDLKRLLKCFERNQILQAGISRILQLIAKNAK